MTKLLYLIDADIYVFRAYFSIPESMTDPEGRPVNAVYGYTDFLLRFLARERPEYVAAFFDESLKTSFRNAIYPGYKASRALPPPDLERQLRLCREITALAGVPEYADSIYEADDLIGSVMERTAKKNFRHCILSSDKDLCQLLRGRDVLWDYARDIKTGVGGVRERFGVKPDRMAELQALTGDPIDDIPGLPGIGPKTAAALLNHFGTLDKLLVDMGKVRSMKIRGGERIAGILEEHGEKARLWLQLTTIARDAPVKTSAKALKCRRPDLAALYALFDKLGFGRRLRTRAERLAAMPALPAVHSALGMVGVAAKAASP